MNNAKTYLILIIISLLIGFGISYAFTDSPEIRIEKENKQAIRECLSWIDYESTSNQILRATETCSQLELKKIIGGNKLNATGGIAPVPPKQYTKKYTLILTGSTSYTKYSDRKWAGWKNNNPSWLTWWVSNTLKWLWDNAWIRYKKGSPRPAKEKGNYIYFETVEEGLRAKIIAIRDRWGNATVSHYLNWWGTDSIVTSFSQSKIIKELSEDEFMELFVQQLSKETPQYVEQLIIDKILKQNPL